MASPKIPWVRLWRRLWNSIPQPLTGERLLLALDDYINPKTGKPVTHNLSSVTVIAESSMQADALATALLVLGPEAGYELAEQEDIASLFMTFDTKGIKEQATPAFMEIVNNQV